MSLFKTPFLRQLRNDVISGQHWDAIRCAWDNELLIEQGRYAIAY
jgi:hypothetical protein